MCCAFGSDHLEGGTCSSYYLALGWMCAVVKKIANLFLFLLLLVPLASALFGLVRCMLPLCLDAFRIVFVSD